VTTAPPLRGLSVASNTVSKVASGAAIGRGRFAADLAAMALGSLAVGGAAAWLTFPCRLTRVDIYAAAQQSL